MATAGNVQSGRAPALAARQLTKIFRTRSGPVVALDDVNVTVPSGGITGLVGPNGAGKTTLIRCWVGFERPTTGLALVAGRSAHDDAPETGWVAYLPQQTCLYRPLSADDHLVLARSLRPGFDAAGAATFLDLRGLDRRRPVGQLSGGQRAQVAIAVALHAGATTILLDEPLASLDPLQRAQLLVDLKAMAARGVTILLSSHIVTDLESVIDDIIVLRSGRVILCDSVSRLLAAHRVVPGRVVAEDGPPILPIPGPTQSEDVLWPMASMGARAVPDEARLPTLNELVLAYLAAKLPDQGSSGAAPPRRME